MMCMKWPTKTALFIFSFALAHLSFAEDSGSFERCEVDAILAEKENKSVAMTCYSGDVKNVWKGCFEKTRFLKPTMHSIAASMLSNESYGEDDAGSNEVSIGGSSKCETTDTARIETENQNKERRLEDLCGYCMKLPQSKKVLVTNIKKDLSFFYLALKDGLVFLNVEVKSGELIRAELQRNSRYSVMEDMYDSAVPAFASNGAEIATSNKMLAADSVSAAYQSSGQDCATTRLNQLKSIGSKLDYQIKMREKEKASCQ